jgi:hypothetical protein
VTHDAVSPNPAVYTSFVQGAANAAGLGGVTWNYLGSTAAQAANGIFINGGVYRLDGQPIAPGGLFDLWDGVLQNPININELGNVQNGSVFTGSLPDGNRANGQTLGSATVMTGQSNSVGTAWMATVGAPAGSPLPLYAISQPLIVGATQQTAVIPGAGGIAIGPNGQPIFTFTNTRSGFWYDPPGTIGFEYLGLSGTLFSSIQLPLGFLDPFGIYLPDGLGGFVFLQSATGGSTVNFGAGVSQFRILNINPSVNSDNPSAFPVLMNFTTQTGSFQMTGIVPEPSTILLSAFGLAMLALQLRRKRMSTLT